MMSPGRERRGLGQPPPSVVRLIFALVSLCVAPGASGAVTIDFEDLNAPGNGTGGLVVANQYARQGITFNFPRAFDYAQGTPVLEGFAHSGSRAIQWCHGIEFCAGPLEMTFTTAQRRVRVWVGYASPLEAGQAVVLRAFDATGMEVAQATTILGPSTEVIPIAAPLEVSLAGPTVVRATVGFLGAEQPFPQVLNDDLAVDDVEFDTPGPPPPCASTQAPGLTVASPVDGYVAFDNAFGLDADVTTSDPFATLRLERAAADKSVRQFGPIFVTGGRVVLNGITGFLAEGRNTLTITVEDCAGEAAATRTLFHRPAMHVEVNQAIQDVDNGVPLFLGKRTLVRVYANTAAATSISAAIYDANALASPMWGPVVVGPVALPAAATRDRLQDTINFELPSTGWIAGHGYVLRTTILQPLATPVTRDTSLTFFDSVPLALMPVWETRPEDGARVSTETFAAAVRRLNVLYPVGRILVRDINLTVPEDRASWAWFGTTRALAGAYDALFESQGVEPPMCSSCYWAAVRTECSPYWCGLAGLNEMTSISTLDAGDVNGGAGILAQEVGHNLGRMHASNAHGEDGGGGYDTAYPYPHGEISDDTTYRLLSNATSRGRYFGADPGTNPSQGEEPWWLIPGSTPDGLDHHHDYMSYGGGQDLWTSAYTYEALSCANRSGRFDSYYGRAAALPPGSLPPPSVCETPPLAAASAAPGIRASGPDNLVPAIVVGGVVREGGVAFAPSYQVDLPSSARLLGPGSGDFLIQLKDASGSILFQRAFSALEHPEGGDVEFSETMPWDERTARIAVAERLDPAAELGHLTRRDGLPRGDILVVPHGELKRPGKVTWTTRHPDGQGGLASTLLFSPGDGKPWRVLAANLTDTEYMLDPESLPGARRGRLRLVTSDGIQSTSVDSAPVVDVAAKPPRVVIVQPADGAVVPDGARLILEASATSPQGGTLSDTAFRWYSDGAFVATGSRVEALGLTAGRHTLRVVVTDSETLSASRQVLVDVSPGSVPVLGDRPGTALPSIGADPAASPPEIAALSVNRPVLWPPHHQMLPVTVAYTLFGDADAPERACVLAVTSDEEPDADGPSPRGADWEVLDSHHVLLRAERRGEGDGRVYTLTVTCTDRRGEMATADVTVIVPKSNGEGSGSDGGPGLPGVFERREVWRRPRPGLP